VYRFAVPDQLMKFVERRPFANHDLAARKLVEIRRRGKVF
jgi:hypothetical protein